VPYPWNDSFSNVNSTGVGLAAKPGITQFNRGVLAYTDWSDPNRPNFTDIDFRKVMRLVRSRDPIAKAADRFDMYYIKIKSADNPDATSVAVASIQIGGPSNTDPQAPGFCRIDGISRPPSGGAQAQPACLYRWDPDNPNGKFEPIDLTTVDDIVLPPLHQVMDRPVANLDVMDVRAVTNKNSPWREEFCALGPRKRVGSLLRPESDRLAATACGR
jgi:hypothetical protein